MDFRKAREPEPSPLQTTMGRRWRRDYFATAAEARAWYELRKAEGHSMYLFRFRNAVAWDQTKKVGLTDAAMRSYPKQRIDHCRHCEERMTWTRTGTGKLDPRKAYRARGFRDYRYVELEPHTCPGLEAERKALRESTARMSKMIARVLGSMRD